MNAHIQPTVVPSNAEVEAMARTVLEFLNNGPKAATHIADALTDTALSPLQRQRQQVTIAAAIRSLFQQAKVEWVHGWKLKISTPAPIA